MAQALRLGVSLIAASDRALARNLTVMIVFSAASTFSIMYYPDLIHIAFIATCFLVCAASVAEWTAAGFDFFAPIKKLYSYYRTDMPIALPADRRLLLGSILESDQIVPLPIAP